MVILDLNSVTIYVKLEEDFYLVVGWSIIRGKLSRSDVMVR